MQNKFRSLQRKLLLFVSLSTLFLVLLASVVSFITEYDRSKIQTETILNQLLDTVEDTVAVAVYSKNEEIASDVLKGLLKNDIVQLVTISSEDGFNLKQSKEGDENAENKVSRPVYSFFDETEVIGRIGLQPTTQYSLIEAKHSTLLNAVSSFVLIFITALIILWALRKYITRPLAFLSGTLHNIHSGEQKLIPVLENNQNDELGQLRLDINNLLSALEEKFIVEQALKEKIETTNDRLSYEREIIENVILKMNTSQPFDDHQIRKIEQPVEKTSGDILLSAIRPDGTRHILLGDFTGHGITAAIGGPVVFDIFYSMTKKNISMHEITHEINLRLMENLPTGLFLGAIFLELNDNEQQLKIWNCGMSDVLIYRDAELRHKIKSSEMALGILGQDFGTTSVVRIENGDRVYIYSDGITEIINSDDEEFGQIRLEQEITKLLQSDNDMDSLYKSVLDYMGTAKQFDDITLLEVAC